MTFESWLEQHLERVGLNQSGLAALLGVGTSTVTDWKYGRTIPRHKNVRAMAEILSVDPEEIYIALGIISDDDDALSRAQKTIARSLDDLSEEDVRQVLDFVEFLLARRRNSPAR